MWVAPQKGAGRRVCTHPPLSRSHLPAYACLWNPAAFPPIILPADPCLMAVSGLQHHQLSDCCTLCSLTWQLKTIYKRSFQFQIESSKRLQCSLQHQKHPAISAAAAFVFTARSSPGFSIGRLFSKGCFVRCLFSVGLEWLVEQSQPPGDRGLFPVRRHLAGLWGCYMGIPVRWEKTMQEGKCWQGDWLLTVSQATLNTVCYCQSFPHRESWAWD